MGEKRENSRHNCYRDVTAELLLRPTVMLKRSIQKAAKTAGVNVNVFCLQILSDAVKSVLLDQSDMKAIQDGIDRNHKRNQRKMKKGSVRSTTGKLFDLDAINKAIAEA